MKQVIIIILVVFAVAASGQSKKILLDSTFVETSGEDYAFYRIVEDYEKELDTYVIKDYYKSGNLLSSGLSRKRDYFSGVGTQIKYYEDGIKQVVRTYDDGELSGLYEEYYPNGKKRLEGSYTKREKNSNSFGSELQIANFWSPENVHTVINGVGSMIDDNKFLNESGEIKNFKKHGTWTGVFKILDLAYTESYIDGKLVSGKSTDETSSYEYSEIETYPQFNPDLKAFYQYVAKNYRTPETSESGRIYITFNVESDGSISGAEIRRGISDAHNAEALRVISNSPKWIPGKSRGKPVRVAYSLPIVIQSRN